VAPRISARRPGHDRKPSEAYDTPSIENRIDKTTLTIADFLDAIKDKKLHFSPGARFEYSNTGYVLLGEIVRRAAHTSSWENLKTNILDPLGLRQTTIGPPPNYPDARAHVARCYSSSREDYADANGITGPLAASEVYADTNIYMTASDLVAENAFRRYDAGDVHPAQRRLRLRLVRLQR
jgi:CubicO group peptidase (beta-lactamase class C family)